MNTKEVEMIATRVGMVAQSTAREAMRTQTLSHELAAVQIRQAVEKCVRDNLTTQGNLL